VDALAVKDRTRVRDAREALVQAVLGDPGIGLPAPSEVSLDRFWERFDSSAPAHLLLGFRVATVLIAVVLPRLLGYGSGLHGLDPERADAVIQKAWRVPGLRELVEVAKVVACFAYFSDPRVQAAVRGAR
jgi:hypothetical protein